MTNIEKVNNFLDEAKTFYFLTVDGDKPKGRPFGFHLLDGDKLYFHCAKAGHKLDAVRREPKVSFCVIDQDRVVPEEYTSYFRSVIAFGTIRIMEDEQEKCAAIEKLAVKYAPEDSASRRQEAIRREWAPLCMLEMTIEHLTGKEAIELVREREAEK